MDKKDEIILQQLDVIRSMTERNLRSVNSDFWGTPLSPAEKPGEKAAPKTPDKAPEKKSGGPEQQTEAPEPLPKEDMKDLLAELDSRLDQIGLGRIVDGVGRGVVLDRDKNYDKVKRAYDALTDGLGAWYS